MKNTKDTIIAVLVLAIYSLSLHYFHVSTLPVAAYIMLCNLSFLAIINAHLIDLNRNERVLSMQAMCVIIAFVCVLSLSLPLAIPTVIGMSIMAMIGSVANTIVANGSEDEEQQEDDNEEETEQPQENGQPLESMLANSNIKVVTMQPNEFFRLQQVMSEVNKILLDTKQMQLAKISIRLVDSCMGALMQYQRGNIPQIHAGSMFDEIKSEFNDLETLTKDNKRYTDDLEVAQRFKAAIAKLTA